MNDFVEILEESISTDVGNIFSNQTWTKNLFDVSVYAENMQDMLFFFTHVRCMWSTQRSSGTIGKY